MRQSRPVGGHAVNAGDRTNRNDAFVRTLVAHHAHGRKWQEHRKRLPHRVVQLRETQLLIAHPIGSFRQPNLVFRNFADDAHREPRTRKWMTSEYLFRYAEFSSN